MDIAETKELAQVMYRKGKAEFFISNTLLKKGATPENIPQVLDEMNGI
jgi:hypothetical protein